MRKYGIRGSNGAEAVKRSGGIFCDGFSRKIAEAMCDCPEKPSTASESSESQSASSTVAGSPSASEGRAQKRLPSVPVRGSREHLALPRALQLACPHASGSSPMGQRGLFFADAKYNRLDFGLQGS